MCINQYEPLVAVVVLHWNRYEDTKECLLSLNDVAYGNMMLVVVDNGSTDGSARMLEREFPSVHFIYNRENLGFSAGNNRGIRYALDNSAQYVLLLNNDTIVSTDFLSFLVAEGEANPRVGALSGTIYYYADQKCTRRIFYAGGKMSFWRGDSIRFRVNEEDLLPNDRPSEVAGFLSGCSMLIKRSVFEDIGLLNEDFFFGVEDADYSWRLTKNGYQLLYVPRSVIWHKESSSRSFHPGEFYNAIVSKAILMRSHYPRIFPIWWLMYALRTRIFIHKLIPYILHKHHLEARCAAPIRKVILKAILNGFSPSIQSGFVIPE